MTKPSDRTIRERHKEVVKSYQRRHRLWTMNALPTMEEAQWKRYLEWVAGFGASRIGDVGPHGRKVRRQMKAARQPETRSVFDAQTIQRIIDIESHAPVKVLSDNSSRMMFWVDETCEVPEAATRRLRKSGGGPPSK